ncbi:MAG: hypothetical protein WBZ29_05235 [Methanocella sp.]
MGSITFFPAGWDKRPKIVPPASKTDLIIEVVAVIGVLLSIIIVIISAVNWSDIIPRQYNPLGGVNTYMSKWPSLASFSLLAIIIYALCTVFNRYPYTFKYMGIVVTEENAPRLYKIGRRTLLYIKTVVVWMILTFEWFFIALINNPEPNPEPSTLLGLILFMLLFNAVLVIIAVYAMIKISEEYKPKNTLLSGVSKK